LAGNEKSPGINLSPQIHLGVDKQQIHPGVDKQQIHPGVDKRQIYPGMEWAAGLFIVFGMRAVGFSRPVLRSSVRLL